MVRPTSGRASKTRSSQLCPGQRLWAAIRHVPLAPRDDRRGSPMARACLYSPLRERPNFSAISSTFLRPQFARMYSSSDRDQRRCPSAGRSNACCVEIDTPDRPTKRGRDPVRSFESPLAAKVLVLRLRPDPLSSGWKTECLCASGDRPDGTAQGRSQLLRTLTAPVRAQVFVLRFSPRHTSSPRSHCRLCDKPSADSLRPRLGRLSFSLEVQNRWWERRHHASRQRLRPDHTAFSWRRPCHAMSGPSIFKAPLGFSSQDHFILVDSPSDSKVSSPSVVIPENDA